MRSEERDEQYDKVLAKEVPTVDQAIEYLQRQKLGSLSNWWRGREKWQEDAEWADATLKQVWGMDTPCEDADDFNEDFERYIDLQEELIGWWEEKWEAAIEQAKESM